MLYTGKGDKGTSKLFRTPPGERVDKDDLVFEVLGSVDELNTFLGICRSFVEDNKKISSNKILQEIQNNLFSLQAQIAGAPVNLSENSVLKMEEKINLIEKIIPSQKSFVVAGEGTKSAAFLDFSRTLCRKTERRLVSFLKSSVGKNFNSQVSLPFINRLSSLLFALARLENYLSEAKEKAPIYYDKI